MANSSSPFRTCDGCADTDRCQLGIDDARLDNGSAVYGLACPARRAGGSGVAHGGWIADVFDEMLGYCTVLHGQVTVTKTLTIQYRRPVPIDRKLEARTWVSGVAGKEWMLRGQLRLDGSDALLSEAEGIFIARDLELHYGKFAEWLRDQE